MFLQPTNKQTNYKLLKKLFMRRFLTLLVTLVVFGVGSALGQSKQVSGIVTSAGDNQPIPGANVFVKEAPSVGTVTDVNGKYSLKNIPANSKILVFRFVGYQTIELPISGVQINASLQSETQKIDEVIVTALGVKRSQKSLAYSASQVKNEEITKGGDRSAFNALQGKVAGVTISASSGAPGSSTRVVLRGYSSISGSNDPLYVVDGVPISNSSGASSTSLDGAFDFGNRANDINPDDIAEISILKGASAAALYGSRAANGVIMITTKTGKNKEKISVVYNGSVTFSNTLQLAEMQNRFGQGWSGQFSYIENGSWGPKFDGVERLWGHTVENQQLYKPFVALKNNVKDFYETGKSFNNSVSVSGGSETASFYASYNNVSDDGILPGNNDTYSRNTFSTRATLKGKKFTISTSVNYSNKAVEAIPGGQGYTVYNNLSQIPRDISIVDMKDYTKKFYNIDNYFTPYSITNPYYTLAKYKAQTNEDRIYGNVELTYDLFSWLKAIVRTGGDVSTNQTQESEPITKPQGNNLSGKQEPGSYTEGSTIQREYNIDAMLMVNRDINEQIHLNATFGYNLNDRKTRALGASVSSLDIPDFYNLSNSAATPTVGGTMNQRRLIGLYTTVEGSYNNYLFLTAGVRNDWTSTLPKDKNSFIYPTFGASFLFTDAFPSLKNILSYGKIRAGWGQTGNDPVAYSLKSIYTSGVAIGYPFGTLAFPFGGINAFRQSTTIGNPNLKPELTSEIEFGADLKFLNNRISTEFTWYKRNTRNQIQLVPIAASTGYTSQWMNLGNVQNTGLECLLSVIPVRTKNVTWTVSANYSFNDNKVIELSDILKKVGIGGTTAIGFVAIEKQPLGLFEGRVYQKSPEGKIIVDGNGLPLFSDQKEIIGKAENNFNMGLSNDLKVGNFSLAATLDYRDGGLMFSRTAENSYFVGNAPQTLYNDRLPFVFPNSVQKYPMAVNGVTKDVYVENQTPISSSKIADFYNNGGFDADRSSLLDKTFIKLREVVLSYSLPSKMFKGSISSLQLSLIGRNLFIWTPNSNRFVDPEATSFGNDLSGNYGEYSGAPSVRSYGFSVKVSF
jgi:TonB-linked SusC/RagA family outer membrane protein